MISVAVMNRNSPSVAMRGAPGGQGDKGDPGGNAAAIGLFTAASGLNIPVGTDAVRTSGHTAKGIGIADYINDAAVDAAYVTAHPKTSFRTANGRGFRLAVSGWAQIEMAGGTADDATDNKAAFDELAALLGDGTIEFPAVGTYRFSGISNVPSGINIVGASRAATTILITGDGGGAAGDTVNGGIQIFTALHHISDLTFSFNNPALQCLMNISGTASVANGRVTLERFELATGPGITAANVNALGLYLSCLVGTRISNGRIRSAVGFKQDCQIRGFFNGCHIENVSFGKHAFDVPGGIFHVQNAQVDIFGSTQAASIRKCTFENGPNGVKAVGQGVLTLEDNYVGDGIIPSPWLPATAVAQGNYICPTVSGITADATSGSAVLANVSSTASLFIGLKVYVIGAGASGGVLTGRITAISGTNVTLDTAAGTTAAGKAVYYVAYAGHGYIATTAGTTGAAPPAWPTALGGTVADNTVTWREVGPCAWLDFSTVTGAGTLNQKEVINVRGGMIFNGMCGINAISGGASRPIYALNISNVNMDSAMVAGHFDGVKSLSVNGVNFGSYTNRGLNVLNSNVFVNGMWNSAATATNKGADVVMGAGSLGIVNAVNPPVGTNAGMARWNGGQRTNNIATTVANITPSFDDDQLNITLSANGRTLKNPTGTVIDGKEFIFRIRDNGTAHTFLYDTQYRGVGVTLPTTTVVNKLLVMRAIYNAADSKMDVIDVKQEA